MRETDSGFKVYDIAFDRSDESVTVHVGYANVEAGHLEITRAIETMLCMFGVCGRCNNKIDALADHERCMYDNAVWRGFIPIVLPTSLFEHVNKEQRREHFRDKSRVANVARKQALDMIGDHSYKGGNRRVV